MSSSKIYFNPSSASPQAFPFPTDVIKYVIKNCNNPTVWFKLIKLCKYFYVKREVLVFKNTTLDDSGSVTATDRSIHKFWEDVADIPCELFLAGKFSISGPLAILKPKIYKCLLRELIISGINVGIEDFEFLVESDILDSFRIRDANITYSDKNVVPLEEVFAALPNVTNFAYEHTSYMDSDKAITAGTFCRMAKTSRNRKLLELEFHGLGNFALLPSDFILFVQNHAGRHCKIFIQFISAMNDFLKESFNQMLEKWEPQSTKPSIKFGNPHPHILRQIQVQQQFNAHQQAQQFQLQYQQQLQVQIQEFQHELHIQRQLLEQEQNSGYRGQIEHHIHAREHRLSELRRTRERVRYIMLHHIGHIPAQNLHGNGNNPGHNPIPHNPANGNAQP